MPRKVKASLAKVVEEYAPDVEIRLSSRRVKTIAARWEGETLVILAPSAISPSHLREMVDSMIEKMERKSGVHDDSLDALAARARTLNQRYLEGKATFSEIKWVTNMDRRWGSCSTNSGRIRLSHLLKDVPEYVLDQVIVHELVHTFEPSHSKVFYEWAKKYPHYERAEGYLEAYSRWRRR